METVNSKTMTEVDSLVLYVRDYCGFCHRVLRVIDGLGLKVEIRNIWQSGEAERELLHATGRHTVPVLRIMDSAGDSRWLPESGEIIRFLEARHSGG